jgi:hypothetical protein
MRHLPAVDGLFASLLLVGCAAAGAPSSLDRERASALGKADFGSADCATADTHEGGPVSWASCLAALVDDVATGLDERARFPAESTVAVAVGELRARWSAVCELLATADDGGCDARAHARCQGDAETHFLRMLDRFTAPSAGLLYVPEARELSQVCVEQLAEGLGDDAGDGDLGAAAVAGETLSWCFDDAARRALEWADRERDHVAEDVERTLESPEGPRGVYNAFRLSGTRLCDALGATELAEGGPAHPLYWYGCDAHVTDILLSQVAAAGPESTYEAEAEDPF